MTKSTIIIARRELQSLFYSPVAYLVLGLFTFIVSLFFPQVLNPGQTATLRNTFGGTVWIMAFLVPALSMRSFAEEYHSGSIEMLMTSPVSDAALVLGKWLSGVVFLVVLMLPLMFQGIILSFYSQPDWGPMISGILGLILVGGLYLAIGVLISAMTSSQLIALLLTMLSTGILTIGLFAISLADWLPDWLRPAVHYLYINQQYEDFAKGLIDTSNFVYFLSGMALLLFLATRVLESRRWR